MLHVDARNVLVTSLQAIYDPNDADRMIGMRLHYARNQRPRYARDHHRLSTIQRGPTHADERRTIFDAAHPRR